MPLNKVYWGTFGGNAFDISPKCFEFYISMLSMNWGIVCELNVWQAHYSVDLALLCPN